jgi:hypothetical protein
MPNSLKAAITQAKEDGKLSLVLLSSAPVIDPAIPSL